MATGIGEGVLRLLRDGGPHTRQQLAESLGASRASVTKEVSTLEHARLVAEGPVAPSSGGRRSATVGLGPAVRVVALSVGETRVRAAVLSGSFALVRPVTLDVARRTEEDLRARALEAVEEALGPDRDVLACGVSVAQDLVGGTEDWVSELAVDVAALTGGAAVVVERSAQAMARGERHGLAGPGRDNLVVVRIGASVTSAAYVDGNLGRGEGGLAGAVGHMKVDEFGPACVCGSSGCLDSFASIRALLDQAAASARAGRSPGLARVLDSTGTVLLPDLIRAVEAGDAVAVQLARDAGRRVGETVSGLVAFANPSRVVVGGPAAALGPHLLNEMRGAIYRRAPAQAVSGVNVELGAPGDRTTLLGAALRATDHVFAELTASG